MSGSQVIFLHHPYSLGNGRHAKSNFSDVRHLFAAFSTDTLDSSPDDTHRRNQT
jgi:hypothetical protein